MEADEATIVLAGAAGARAEFVSGDGKSTSDKFLKGFEMSGSKDISYSVVAQKKTTPLFRLARLKRRMFGKPQFVRT